MRRIGTVLMAALVMTASVAGAESRRGSTTQTAKAARVKPPIAKPAPAPAPRTVKSAVKAAVPVVKEQPVADTEATIDNPKPLPITANALLMQYQRVGRDLMLLSNERRAKEGAENLDATASCGDLQTTFRSIKVEDAVKTPESRAAAAATLSDLHAKIVRLRGVEVSKECLNNPLAKDCT